MIINKTTIGQNDRPFVIAEVAQTHDGSLGNAFSFIDAASVSGVSAIKFQTHIASEESTRYEPWRIPFSRQDVSRYDYWKRLEFSKSQWLELKEYAEKKNLTFLSSPFSIKACDLLMDIGVEAWKVASGEMHNQQLLNYLIGTKKPMILSSGLSSPQQVQAIVGDILEREISCALLHCTTMYPTPAVAVGMNIFEDFRQMFSSIPVGISDHSGTIYPSIVAAYEGASIYEVHLALHANMFGPDVSSSLLPEELASLVEGVNFAWEMRNNKVVKIDQLDDIAREKIIFSRSIFTSTPIMAGEKITPEHLAYKKPGGGLDYSSWQGLLGRTLTKDVASDHMLSELDVK